MILFRIHSKLSLTSIVLPKKGFQVEINERTVDISRTTLKLLLHFLLRLNLANGKRALINEQYRLARDLIEKTISIRLETIPDKQIHTAIKDYDQFIDNKRYRCIEIDRTAINKFYIPTLYRDKDMCTKVQILRVYAIYT